MGKLGEAVVEVRPDLRGLDAGLAGAEKAAGAFVGRTNRLLAGVGAVAIGAAGGAGIAAALFDSAKKAADLGESLSKTRASFGGDAKQIEAAADDLAKRFGLVKQETLDAATAIGLMGSAAGLSQRDAAKLGVEMARLAADVSSFFNLPMADALEKIRSGLAGEAEPLRALGVFLSEDAVKAEALRMGLVKTSGALTEQSKILARVSLIKSAPSMQKASGDLERTADSASNQLKKLEGDLANFKADFGANLIGPMTEGIALARELGATLDKSLGGKGDQLGETLQSWIGALRLANKDLIGNTIGQRVDNPLAAEWGVKGKDLQSQADEQAGVKTGLSGSTAEETLDRQREITRRVAAAKEGQRAKDEADRQAQAARQAAFRDALHPSQRAAFERAAEADRKRLEFQQESRRLGLTDEANAYRRDLIARKKDEADTKRFNSQEAVAGLGQLGKSLAASAVGALRGGASTLLGGSRAETMAGRAQLGQAAAAGVLSGPAAKLISGAAAAVQSIRGEVEKPKTQFSAQVLSGAESFQNFAQVAALDGDTEKQQLAAAKEAAGKLGESVELLKELVRKGGDKVTAVVRGRRD